MTDSVLLEIEGGVARLCLNRPQVHNVINEEVMTQLEQALDLIDGQDHLTTVVLTASGSKTFCAGGDLRYFSSLTTRDQVLAMSRRMQAILNRLYQGKLPVIGAINGSAYGGGCEILTACHFRVASETAHFQFRQSAMGVVTGWGGGLRLFQQIGRHHALELLLAGERIDSGTALRMGLLNRIVHPATVLEEALNFAARIGERSPLAVQSFLELARFAEDHHPSAIREKETQLFADCWTAPWFGEAMNRFLNKKKDS